MPYYICPYGKRISSTIDALFRENQGFPKQIRPYSSKRSPR